MREVAEGLLALLGGAAADEDEDAEGLKPALDKLKVNY